VKERVKRKAKPNSKAPLLARRIRPLISFRNKNVDALHNSGVRPMPDDSRYVRGTFDTVTVHVSYCKSDILGPHKMRSALDGLHEDGLVSHTRENAHVAWEHTDHEGITTVALVMPAGVEASVYLPDRVYVKVHELSPPVKVELWSNRIQTEYR
jgi:hypothetical protein